MNILEVQFQGGKAMDDGGLITVGRIVKSFGVRGQVRVQSLTDVPRRLETLQKVVLILTSGQHVETSVTDVQIDGRSHLLKFAAFSTPEEAKLYRGARLAIPPGPVPEAPEGHWYQYELIGLTVQDQNGAVLGVVEDVLEMPSHHLFVVKHGHSEMFIPAVRKWITHVDIQGKIMTVVHPDEWNVNDAM